MLQLKLASLTVTIAVLFLSAGCSNSEPPQTPAAAPTPAPAATVTPAPGLAPINKVKDKVNDANQKETERQKETENP